MKNVDSYKRNVIKGNCLLAMKLVMVLFRGFHYALSTIYILYIIMHHIRLVGFHLSVFLLFCVTPHGLCPFVRVLPLSCMAWVAEEGLTLVGLIRMLGCGGIVLLVGSHVQRLVAGWAECSGCSGDCELVHLYLSCCFPS